VFNIALQESTLSAINFILSFSHRLSLSYLFFCKRTFDLACCRLFNASHYGSSNLASNLASTNLNLGSLGGSVSPTGSNMSACMVQGGASSSGVPVSTGMAPHVTPHSPSEAKSGYPYLGSIDSQVCGRIH